MISQILVAAATATFAVRVTNDAIDPLMLSNILLFFPLSRPICAFVLLCTLVTLKLFDLLLLTVEFFIFKILLLILIMLQWRLVVDMREILVS
jgi:hypothetical protein